MTIEPTAWRWRRHYGPEGRQPGAWNYSDGPHKPIVASPDRVAFEPLYAAPGEAEREAWLAVEYAANRGGDFESMGEFVYAFVANDLPQFLADWAAYATWRAERRGAAS